MHPHPLNPKPLRRPAIREMLQIKGFQKNTFLDWDGKIASILFLPGCNFRCPYCHASELVCRAATLQETPLAEVEQYLRNNRQWIDGVVITGGEATIHRDMPALVDRLLGLGVQVKLFTNGTNPVMLRDLLQGGKLAALSMDIKGPLDDRYSYAAGVPVDLDAVRESIGLLMNSGIPYEFRTTVCPAVLTIDDAADTARGIEGANLFILQQFRPVDCLDPRYENVRPYSDRELDAIAALAQPLVKKCVVQK